MTPESQPESQPESRIASQDVILEYIRANRGTYNRDAIERELREAGHTQEAIDAAWLAFPPEGETLAPPPGRVVATLQFWVLLLLVACFALAGLPLLSAFVVSGIASFAAQTDLFDNGVVVVLLALAPILLGYLAIGLGGRWFLRRDRAIALGIFSGLVVAFVLSIIVAGSCAAIITQL